MNDIVGFAQKRLSDVQPWGYVTIEGARESRSLRIIHSFIHSLMNSLTETA
jgi:hypothetical protein